MSTTKKRARHHGKEVLNLVKRTLPEFYNQHIKGRQAKFINEHKPIESIERDSSKEEKIGRVTKDLQMLWALGEMFHQLADDSGILREGSIRGVSEAYQAISDLALDSSGAACKVLLWSDIRRRLEPSLKQFVFRIQSDWSLTRELCACMPTDLVEQAKQAIPGRLLFLIERQMGICNLVTYVKSHNRIS